MKKDIKQMSTDELAKMLANAVVDLHKVRTKPKKKKVVRKGKKTTVN